MKSISFAGGTLTTGDAVAASLLDRVSRLSPTSNSITVDIPVLEPDDTVSTHTIVLSAAVQLDVTSTGRQSPGDEAGLFPVPELPDDNDLMIAVIPSDDSDEGADNFNRAIADIDLSLDSGHEN